MPNLKDIKTRIGAVKNTRKITSAMKLVAAAKLKRATDKAQAALPYREQLEAVLKRVASAAGEIDEPLLQPRDEVKNVLVVVLTSDRGLCGPFNNNLLRKTTAWLKEQHGDHNVKLAVFGRKGDSVFKRSRYESAREAVTDYGKTPKMDMVRPLTGEMVAGFVDGEFDECWLVYNHFVNTLVQEPTFSQVLPLSVEAGEDDASSTNYRYEPDSEVILSELLPLYLQTIVLQAFLETEAGDHAARMTAMDNATSNAGDIIDRLTLQFNRARQAAITTEIIEIVSGAAALE